MVALSGLDFLPDFFCLCNRFATYCKYSILSLADGSLQGNKCDLRISASLRRGSSHYGVSHFTFLYALSKKPRPNSLGFLRIHLIFYILGHVFHYLQDSLGGEAEGKLIHKKKQEQISHFVSSQCKCNIEPVPCTC